MSYNVIPPEFLFLVAQFNATFITFGSIFESFSKRGEKMYRLLDAVFATVGAFVGYFFGGMDGILYALLVFIVIDYISGVLVAISKRQLSSSVGFKGISKKILILLLVGIANIIDQQILGKGSAIRTATIFFYMSNEGISILENSANLGLPLPKKLLDFFGKINNNDDVNKED